MSRTRPHFKIHTSIRNHRKMAAVYADDAMLATWTRIGVVMIECFADRTDDHILLSGRDLCMVAGCEQVSGAVQRLRKLADISPLVFLDPRCAPDAHQIPTSLRPVVDQMRASSRRVWVLGLPNFAKKQGFGPRNHTRTPSSPTPTPTPTASKTVEPPRKAPSEPSWARDAAALMIDLLRSVKGARVPPQARARWAKEIRLLEAESDASQEEIVAGIQYALAPEQLDDQYCPVIRSGKALREKWPKLVAHAKRKRQQPDPKADLDEFMNRRTMSHGPS